MTDARFPCAETGYAHGVTRDDSYRPRFPAEVSTAYEDGVDASAAGWWAAGARAYPRS
jgi:hypothetical protein